MRLYDEIFKDTDGVAFARCSIIPRGGGYFENVKAVEEFSDERISLCFPHDRLVVEGENLSIKKYCDGDLQIAGNIFSLSVETDQRAENGKDEQNRARSSNARSQKR
ncbi:MAG: YabP/YqfC family sporulation protein [Clostridia bacterium]|nr:YabP/YqfC family sporulation protein [Clostridia bacterium]